MTAFDPRIHCPQCGYSLRGLDGTMVTCPECGTLCDVAEIIRHRRVDRWHNPEYRLFSAPAAMLTGGLVLGLLFSSMGSSVRNDMAFMWIGCLVVLTAWLAPLTRALVRGGDAEGVRLLIVLHVVYLGFAILVLGGLGLFIVKMVAVADALGMRQWNRATIQGSVALGAALVCMGSVPLLRWLDRGVGRACIRRMLRRDAY